MGERRSHLRFAVEAMRALGRLEAVSSLWETAPIGGPAQTDYLNAVVVSSTVLGPRPLLGRLLDIEVARGRSRSGQAALPRTLDLDLLLYGDAIIESEGLAVPHPRMTERRFVLEPLAEAWPDAYVPGHGTVEELLTAVSDQDCRRVAEPEWAGEY